MAKGSTTATRGPTTAGDVKPEVLAEELSALDVDLEDRPLPDDGHQHRPRLDDDDERDRKPAGLQYEPDPRDALAKNFAKARAVEGRELSTDYEDELAEEAEENGEEDDGEAEVQIVAGPGAREINQPKAPERRVRSDLQPDDLVVIKVDGADVQMTYAEMQALAQKNAAADNRLKDANAIVDEVRSIADRIKNSVAAPADRHPDGGQADPAARPAPSGQTKVDKARLQVIVDQIQTDSPDKGAEALAAYLEEIVAPQGQTNAQDVQSIVRTTIATEQSEREAAAEIGNAYVTVKETFGDVLDDENPRLANMAFEDASSAVIAALRKAGTPDADFAYVANEAAKAGERFELRLMRQYARLSKNPEYKLPAIGEIFANAASGVRQWRTGDVNVPVSAKGRPVKVQSSDGGERRSANTPARIVVSSERRERKAGMTVQPRSASMRTDHSVRTNASRKDTSKTIADMAATRR